MKKPRVILYVGKGGVGKTTIAAATACRSAELGYRTIAISTDAAHSLADSFDISLGNGAQLIAPNLWAQETSISQTLNTYWGTIQKWLSTLLAWRGMDEIVAEEMAVFPGMEELSNLLYVLDYYNSGKYDVIIVDCAPTADTLRLLSFPEILRWWMEKMFPIGRKFAGIIRPLVTPIFGMGPPPDEVFDSAQDLFNELRKMRALLTNPNRASIRLVLNPEKMVIKEAQRIFTYLNLYGYSTDLIICNRLIPERVEDSYFHAWKESQRKYYQVIEECFAPLRVLTAPLMEQEVVGLPMLKLMADNIYGEDDPTKVFFLGQAQEIQKKDNHYVLTIPLPFTNKEQISLTQSGDELIIRVGNVRRNIALPHILVGLPVKEAGFEQDKLKIQFEEQKASIG